MVVDVENGDSLRCENQRFVYNGDTPIAGSRMLFVNYQYIDSDRLVVDDKQHFMTQIYCRPREEEKKFDLSAYLNRKMYGWTVETSIFKNYQPDNEALIGECFEFDFQSSKIARLVKE